MVRHFDEVYFDGEAKEAVAFALLGYLHVTKRPPTYLPLPAPADRAFSEAHARMSEIAELFSRRFAGMRPTGTRISAPQSLRRSSSG